MKNKLTLITTTLLFCTLFVLSYNSFAQAGSLDLTFDTDGKVTTDFGASNDLGYTMAIQSDGKIVVAGFREDTTTFIRDFALARYNTNGSLDLSFDTDGKVITAIGTSGLTETVSVAIQGDGKIVLVGTVWGPTDVDIVLVRYNTNGNLDNTFGTGGKVTTDFGASDDIANSVAIQSDGKIVVAGASNNGTNLNFALVRYNTNGSLDNTFDTDGKVITPVGIGINSGFSVAIQSDGKIVVAGASKNGTNLDFALVRYNTNGSLDNTFDTDGKVTTPFGTADAQGYSVAIQSDGKILVAGVSDDGTNIDLALVRYNTNGSLDLSFDTDGKVTTVNYGFIEHSIAIQSDGKIVVTGIGFDGTDIQFAILRYNTNGSLDLSFDTDGKVITTIGVSSFAIDVAIQSDGKIVVAGTSHNGFLAGDFAVARYNNAIGSSINETADLSKGIYVFPNPFSTIATLQTSNSLKNASLTIYNLFGQAVKQINSISIAAGGTIRLTRDNLPSGNYFIQLIEDNQIISKNKLVITD